MSHVRLYLDAMLATIKRDAAVFLTYRLRLPSQALSVLFTLTTFFYLGKLVRPDAVGARGHYFGYALVGVVTTLVLSSALNTAQIVRQELMTGNFERIVISPLGPVWGVISVILFPIAYSTVLATLTLALAVLIYGVPLDAANIVPALAVGLLGAVSLACIGLLFVASLIAFKSAVGVTWVIAGFGLLGGAYFPLRLFPVWIHWFAYVQPYTPTIDLLRHLLVQTRAMNPLWSEVARLVGFIAALVPLTVGALWSSVAFSRRRGTMMEF